MSKTKIWTGTEWSDPPNISVFTGTAWETVNKVHVFTASGWVEVWPGELVFPESGTLDADWWVLTFWYRAGLNLDIRVFCCEPDINQDDTKLIGADMISEMPVGASDAYLKWGGDVTVSGEASSYDRKLSSETVLVNVRKIEQDFPNATEIRISMRAFWPNNTSANPEVVAGAVGYVGGTPELSSATGEARYWTVAGSTELLELQDQPFYSVSLNQQDIETTGQYLTTFRFNLSTHLADFVDDDCVIPEGLAANEFEFDAGVERLVHYPDVLDTVVLTSSTLTYEPGYAYDRWATDLILTDPEDPNSSPITYPNTSQTSNGYSFEDFTAGKILRFRAEASPAIWLFPDSYNTTFADYAPGYQNFFNSTNILVRSARVIESIRNPEATPGTFESISDQELWTNYDFYLGISVGLRPEQVIDASRYTLTELENAGWIPIMNAGVQTNNPYVWTSAATGSVFDGDSDGKPWEIDIDERVRYIWCPPTDWDLTWPDGEDCLLAIEVMEYRDSL